MLPREKLGHIRSLIDLAQISATADLVFGSPAQPVQRRAGTPLLPTRRYVDGLASVAPHALDRGVTILVEALPRGSVTWC